MIDSRNFLAAGKKRSIAAAKWLRRRAIQLTARSLTGGRTAAVLLSAAGRWLAGRRADLQMWLYLVIGCLWVPMMVLLFVHLASTIHQRFADGRLAFQQYQVRAAADREQALRTIADRCTAAGGLPVERSTCMATGLDEYLKGWNVNKDLEAQQDMAFWAMWSVLIGGFALTVNGLGLFFLWRSLTHTAAAISIDREVGHAQVRAYLTIKPSLSLVQKSNKQIEVQFAVANHGQSPAYDVNFHGVLLVEQRMTTSIPIERALLGNPSTNHNLTIVHNAEMFGLAQSERSLTDAEYFEARFGGSLRMVMTCIATYRDVFGVTHATRFLGSLEVIEADVVGPDGKRGNMMDWALSASGNDAD